MQIHVVDKQFSLIVILMLIGLGLTQIRSESDAFYTGLGLGTVGMASVWLIIKIIHDYRKK